MDRPIHNLSADSSLKPFLEGGRLLDNETLLRQAFTQDARQGFTALFRLYYQPLCNHAVRYLHEKDTAEDIVEDVLLNFWRTQAYQHITTSFSAYLFGAVRNRVFNHLRDSVGRQRVELDAAPANACVSTEDPEQILQSTELFLQIQQTVREMPPQCQRVFVLNRFEGKKTKQIAEELNLSPKTVEMHLTRALSMLRRLLHDSLR
jgi:RNA polymerase sigma-70 factor (ECF subfamily)